MNTSHEAKLPYAIDVRLTSKCNMRCPFCFGPRHSDQSLSLHKAEYIIDVAAKSKSKAIVFSGGEPTLNVDLPTILKYAREKGLQTILSTNGIRLGKIIREIAEYVDCISLPIDAYSQPIHSTLRIGDAKHFDIILNLIKFIKTQYKHLRLNVGTVVTSINKDYIDRIPELFEKHAFPDKWKIYQVSYSNYGLDNKIKLQIADEDFLETCRMACNNASKHGLKVVTYMNADRNGKYFFVNPNGDVIVIANDVERVVGNILKDPISVQQIWRSYVDNDKLTHNFVETYR